jgi:hypothetical protein
MMPRQRARANDLSCSIKMPIFFIVKILYHKNRILANIAMAFANFTIDFHRGGYNIRK